MGLRFNNRSEQHRSGDGGKPQERFDLFTFESGRFPESKALGLRFRMVSTDGRAASATSPIATAKSRRSEDCGASGFTFWRLWRSPPASLALL
jgi:hypothetical protein